MSGPYAIGEPLLARLVAAVLDPVLCSGPFSRGDGQPPGAVAQADVLASEMSAPWPEPEHSVQLLWCAPAAEVSETLPGLWRQVGHQVPETGGCVDVTVDVDVLGRLVAADIEAVPLADLLVAVDEPEAAAAAAELPGLSAEVAIPALGDLLERLLVAAQTG